MTITQRALLGFIVGYTVTELFGPVPWGLIAIAFLFYLDYLLNRYGGTRDSGTSED